MHVEARIRIVAITITLLAMGLLTVGGALTWRPPATPSTVLVAAVLAGLIVFSDFFDIDLPLTSVRVTVSVSSAICFAAALSLGPEIGALVAAGGGLIVELIQRRPVIKLSVNVSNYALATFFAGWVYTSLARLDVSPIANASNILVTVAAAAVYTVVESTIMAIVLSQVVGTSPWHMWRASAYGVLFECITLPTLGSLIPVLKDQSPLALVIAVVPLLGPYLAFRSYRRINDETRKTIELLADMLDRRDPYTSEHSKRVTTYVQGILEHLDDVSSEEADLVIAAARIHDLGKVSTSDGTLMKPDRLTEEERLLIQRHAADGAEILQNLSMYREASVIVRHHHERWDGAGYPDRLAGDRIPLGARIIAVADTYDAMTSDRIYRRALSHQVAMSEIERCAGSQFDPRIVDAFSRAMGRVDARSPAAILRTASPE